LLEHGQLLPHGCVFQSNLPLTTEHQNDQAKSQQNSVQNEPTTVPRLMEESTAY
jgi:hypothetical protein